MRTPNAPVPTPAPLGEIAAPLVAWYRTHKRDLPWRRDPTPYRVWVSEIMLQQTRVEAVRPYFDRFLEALPTVGDLADAPEDTLLKLWEGLGYYSRVRHMQTAARQISERFGGVFPRTRDELLSLCGIGSYTAGAIAAFALGLPEPAVDGNVLRVVARLTADERNILDPRVREDCEAALRPVIPRDCPGEFGQGLIELGALVCLPGRAEAKCDVCPLAHLCRARAQGLTGILPVRYKETKRREQDRTVLLVTDGERLLIRQRPPRGLLAGLWEFPHTEGHLSPAEVQTFLRETFPSLSVLNISPLPPATHVFTHLTWHMVGYLVRVSEIPAEGPASALRVTVPGALARDYALPSAFAVYKKEALALLSPAAAVCPAEKA